MVASRRAQAALEFLSTYGAAFMLLLVALGVLSYTGIFNIASLRSDDCSMPPGIQCVDFVLSSATAPGGGALNLPPAGSQGFLRAVLQNTYGVNVTLVNVTMTGRQFIGLNQTCRVYSANIPENFWPRGTNMTVWCAVPPASYRGNQRYDTALTMNFTQQGGSYQHLVRGTISVESQ